jgi:hypothetical protein
MVRLLKSEEGMEALFGVPFFVNTTTQGDRATHVALPARLKMVVTEYNIMERSVRCAIPHCAILHYAPYALRAPQAVGGRTEEIGRHATIRHTTLRHLLSLHLSLHLNHTPHSVSVSAYSDVPR